MFKALDRQNQVEIILLAEKWRTRLEELRALDHADALLCQECLQPVRLRAGAVKRWHFAHKHANNCPYERESPELLEARAMLYRRLVEEFGEQASLERRVGNGALPRAVDCWVDAGAESIAYWIFDAGLRPEARVRLDLALLRAARHAHYLFTATMLRPEAEHPDTLHLTTTERELSRQTYFDLEERAGGFGSGTSLHYLDAATESLITYRQLHLVHEPQGYAGQRWCSPLAAALISRRTGELAHPGELEQARQLHQRKQLAEQAAMERRELPARTVLPAVALEAAEEEAATALPTPGQPAAGLADREGVCIFCGRTTTDWWKHDGATGRCKCRDCLRQGRF